MPEGKIVLHHYARSPFSEKIRLAFGLKRVHWHSVLQPRIAPKPDLVPLTGGYRRIPVMQIGADIYCDTRCILAELERRIPTPSLYPPGTAGLADMVAGFADRFLFADALGLVFARHGDRFPPELHADRARFTAGRFDGWDPVRMAAKLPSLPHHFDTHRAWIERLLSDGRAYLLGPEPGVADLSSYHPLWYAQENLGPEEIGWRDYPNLQRWMARIGEIGHGTPEELPPSEALAQARAAEPAPLTGAAPATALADPLIGRRVNVTPDDWGFDPVEGELMALDPSRIVVRRRDPQAGTVMVHFPHTGFVVTGV